MDALAAHTHVAASRAGRASSAVPGSPTPIGWCSWYCHGPNVSEELMLTTISRLAESRATGALPIELAQLDDGWQSEWGDWLTPHPTRFPNGLRPVSDAAKAAGMRAGLWMAPFRVSSPSIPSGCSRAPPVRHSSAGGLHLGCGSMRST